LDLPLTHPATVLASSDKDELEARLRPHHWSEYALALKPVFRKATGYGRNKQPDYQ
jgi:hypothetical protein